MDCDDVMLALADRERTLTDQQTSQFHHHLEDCEACRTLVVDQQTAWRWIARLPEDALDGELASALPTVDPIVFEVDQEIASGGMGRITKATDRRLGREVALKEVLDLSLRARFEREALITARLQHPAIVPIYEAGTFPNGHPFYTMRLVWGGTLAAAIERATTLERRLALLPHVIAATEALAYAHDHRIIHRDLKPGNVLVGEFGETVVIDWGLAKELGSAIDAIANDGIPTKPSSPNLTRVGSVLGTPGFMSPEQASGAAIDERADVYALGAILYNLLAGAPPYWDEHAEGGSTQLIAIGLERPPTPIAERAPEAPADLRTIVEKAMSRRKEDRYPTAKEMAHELRRFAAGQLIARPYTLRELVARWIAKHRTAVVVGAIAALALAVVTVLAFVGITRSRSAERDARLDAERARADAVVQRDAARRTAAELQENEGIRELRDGDGSRASAYLAAAYGPQRTADPAYHYLLTAAAHDLGLELDSYAPADPREVGKAIAFAGDRPVIVDAIDRELVIRRAGAIERRLSLGPDPILGARFAPGGALVAVERPHRLEVWDLIGVRRLAIADLAAPRVAFDAHGQRFAAAAGRRLVVYALGDAPEQLLEHELPDEVRDLALDDHGLAACTAHGVTTWRIDALDRPPATLPGDCSLVAFLAPGQLVFVHDKYELRRWTVGAAAADRTMSGHIPINVLAVDQDARRIATGDATGVVMWKWDGTAVGESRDITGGIDKLQFTHGGAAIVGAGADDRVFVWDTQSFHLRQAFGGKRGAITAIAVDASGERIASLAERRAQVWKVPAGRLLHHLPGQQFVLAGGDLVTALPNALELHSLVDRRMGGRSISRVAEVIELRADATRVTALGANRMLVTFAMGDVVIPAAVPLPPTVRLTPDPQLLLDVQPAAVRGLAAADRHVMFELAVAGATGAIVSADRAQVAVISPRRLDWFELGDPRRPVQTVELPDGHRYEGRFDPAGGTLVLFGDHVPTLLVTRSGVRTLTADAATGAAWSADGKRLVLGASNSVQLWALGEPRPRFSVSSTQRDAYAIDRTGQLLATGSVDGSIRIWDDRGRLLDRLVGSQQTITRIAFAMTDTRLIAQSADRHVTVWDVHVDAHSAERVAAQAADSGWTLDGAQLVPTRP